MKPQDRTTMKKTIILLLVLFLTQSISPQLRRAMLVEARHETSGPNGEHDPRMHAGNRAEEVLPDTVYCTRIKKQHGWYVPLKTISEENARHVGVVYRFTNRNARGRWCKMESINGRGEAVPSGLSPYILNIYTSDSDMSADPKWVEKLKTTCTFELIPDPSGTDIIQERALDKDGNIVYLFSRTPIGRDNNGYEQYVGTYKDCYGLPAEMRKEPGYTYGTLVLITEDRWGNDWIVEYMDAAGITRPNSFGVSAEYYVCDDRGRVLRMESRDAKGRLVAGIMGSCGVEYTWSGYDISSVTFMDASWKPARMLSSRPYDGNEGGIRINSRYDRYGRQTELFYTLEDGVVPDCNVSGIHRITYSYNDYGDITEVRFFGPDNRPVNNRYSEIAIVKKEYDGKGRVTEQLNLDMNENPAVTELYPSRSRYGYDESGRKVMIEEYSAKSGLEELVYKYERTGNRIYEMLGDGTYEIDSLDSEGRLLSVSHHDRDGSRRTLFSGWAGKVIKYGDEKGKNVQTVLYLDSEGNQVNVGTSGSKYVKATDSLSYTSKSFCYDKDGHLIETVATVFDTTFTKIRRIYDINRYGNPCRSGGYNGERWYAAEALYSCKDELSSFIGRDEFGERDYIDNPSSGELYYYRSLNAKGYNKFYDENNDVITDFRMLRNELPKVMSVEVTDSVAYSYGLMDNDVILVYGQYSADLDEVPTLNDIMSKWALYTIMEAGEERRMVVFRVDPVTLECKLVEIPSLKGPEHDTGFIAHVRYLTKAQKARIEKTIDENIKSDNPLVAWSDFDRGNIYAGERPIIIVYPDMCRNVRYKPFQQKITSPAILLASSMRNKNMTWRNGMELSAFADILAFRELKSAIYVTGDYAFTGDMSSVITYEQKKDKIEADWIYSHVNESVYRKIQKLWKKTARMRGNEYVHR